jgi:hypothetical protein
MLRQSVAAGRVWWWAQNWAQWAQRFPGKQQADVAPDRSRRIAIHIFTRSEAMEVKCKTARTTTIRSERGMEEVWITTAEVQVEPGDMPSGDVLGFMKITMWASSAEEFINKINLYLSKYRWKLLSMEKTQPVDQSLDYGNEVNEMIDETLKDRNAVRLGTFFSYKPN